jgi:hypothetical protein
VDIQELRVYQVQQVLVEHHDIAVHQVSLVHQVNQARRVSVVPQDGAASAVYQVHQE